MKRLFTLTLVILLLACCVACGEGDITVSEGESSVGAEQSTESSKPWYETSVPESYSSEAVENSSQAESVPEESEPEVSEPEESEPEVSEPEESDDEYEWRYSKGEIFLNAAKGYKVVYTKVKPINALSCYNNGDVTSVYDGEITRFFNSKTGEFYCSVIGEYLLEPNSGAFYPKDKYREDADMGIPMIFFEWDYANNKPKNINYDFWLETGYSDYYFLFDGDTEIIYKVEAGDDVPDYSLGGEGLFTCTLWEDLSKKKVYDFFETEAYQTFKAELPSKKYGLVTNESIIIPFEYDYMSDISHSDDGVGIVMAVKDGKTYYFASDGTNLTPDGFDCGVEPRGNHAWVFKDGQGYIIEFYS